MTEPEEGDKPEEETKLKKRLKELGISQTQFAKQVKKKGLRSKSWGDQVVRGEIGLDERRVIKIVLPVLKEMSGRNDLTLQDVMEDSTTGTEHGQSATNDEYGQRSFIDLVHVPAQPVHDVGEISKGFFPVMASIMALVFVFSITMFSSPLRDIRVGQDETSSRTVEALNFLEAVTPEENALIPLDDPPLATEESHRSCGPDCDILSLENTKNMIELLPEPRYVEITQSEERSSWVCYPQSSFPSNP